MTGGYLNFISKEKPPRGVREGFLCSLVLIFTMKLLLIITQKEDSKKLEQALISGKFQLTRFDSFGGFLQKKNATYIVGVEDEKVGNVLDLVKRNCKSKEEVVTPPVAQALGLGEVVPQAEATKIVVGGAIVFIMSCDKVVKF